MDKKLCVCVIKNKFFFKNLVYFKKMFSVLKDKKRVEEIEKFN